MLSVGTLLVEPFELRVDGRDHLFHFLDRSAPDRKRVNLVRIGPIESSGTRSRELARRLYMSEQRRGDADTDIRAASVGEPLPELLDALEQRVEAWLAAQPREHHIGPREKRVMDEAALYGVL